MGGAVPGTAFFFGGFVAAAVGGLLVGAVQRQFVQTPPWSLRIVFHLIGLLLTAVIWQILLTREIRAEGILMLAEQVEFTLWLTAFALLPWFTVGWGVWITLRDAQRREE
jgi:hypothetical protein